MILKAMFWQLMDRDNRIRIPHPPKIKGVLQIMQHALIMYQYLHTADVEENLVRPQTMTLPIDYGLHRPGRGHYCTSFSSSRPASISSSATPALKLELPAS